GGEYTVYMCIALQFLRIQEVGYKRGRIVTAVPAQGSGLVFGVGTYKPCYNIYRVVIVLFEMPEDILLGKFFQGLCISEFLIRFDEFPRIGKYGIDTFVL